MKKELDIAFDLNKLKTLVQHVCHKVANPHDLGKTKLNKILFYSDIEAYLSLGRPITGEEYVKHQYGPVSRHLDEVLDSLQEERLIAISEASGYHAYIGAYNQKLFHGLKKPRLDAFSADEISIADDMVTTIAQQHTAQSISGHSHDVIWKSAQIGETLPYYTAFAHTLGEVTPDDMVWAQSVLKEKGR